MAATMVSSKDITARSSGTANPTWRAASRTPSAWASLAAKTAVGGSAERRICRLAVRDSA
jgi:hypothetical protein